MTKKDYERAATMVQRERGIKSAERACLISFLVEFFASDNFRFDAQRFRRACEPGANVRARGRAA